MRILSLISVAVSCATAVSSLSAVKTPSELCEEAEALKICKDNDSDSLFDALLDKDIEIGDLTPEKFCRIHSEVCNMIEKYDQDLTMDYIYNLDKYLTCDESDAKCIHGKNISCGTVLKLCWGNYPNKACQKLGNVCKKLSDMDTIKEPVEETIKESVKEIPKEPVIKENL
ncbi:hypothetical protein PIROE2DRAFT_10819 [Piromyces sp. E2]|nr:hypothetical protein PIROE2DRAFT_10819 [Piromyces sp. E2]|eukprot:OUM62786.1 hypothetical protein PIROE2DRAFT_10819 [Piromyces sp. E2]